MGRVNRIQQQRTTNIMLEEVEPRSANEATPLNQSRSRVSSAAVSLNGSFASPISMCISENPLDTSWTPAIIVGMVAVIITVASTVAVGTIGSTNYSPSTFAQRTTMKELNEHLENFFAISNKSDPPSRSTLIGLNESANYVEAQLLDFKEGFRTIVRQPFTTPIWRDFGEHTMIIMDIDMKLSLKLGVDFYPLRFSGSNRVPAIAGTISLPANACSPDQYQKVQGRIVAMPDMSLNSSDQGTPVRCSLYARVLLAELAGALGVVVVRALDDNNLPNEWVSDTNTGFDPDEPFISIPVIGVLYTFASLVEANVTVNMTVHANSSIVDRFNLLAVYPGRLPYAIVIGSHLDSVPQSPGINDNGSGCAVILAMARQLAQFKLNAKLTVIFAFWGASEEGHFGSKYFVKMLNTTESPVDIPVIAYVNFDTIASPNFGRFVLNAMSLPSSVRHESKVFTNLFNQYFEFKLQSHALIPFSLSSSVEDSSDYFPFIFAGIPVGGITAGSSGIKNSTERVMFGGLSGVPYDPCFHQPCDSLQNVDKTALRDMSQAAAYVTWQVIGTSAFIDTLNINL